MVCSLWEAYKAWEDAGAVPKEFKEEDRPVPLAPKNLRKSSDWFRMVPICQHGGHHFPTSLGIDAGTPASCARLHS